MLDYEKIGRENLHLYVEKLYEFIIDEYPSRVKLESKIDQKEIAEVSGISESVISRLARFSTYEDPKKNIDTSINNILHVQNAFKIKSEILDKNEYIFDFFPPQEDEKLKELATKFASNLVDVSTRFEEKDDPHKETIKEIERKKYRTPEQRERFILITGAGASHAATKGVMPLSSQAIINIKREFDKAKFPHQIIEEEIEKIKLTTRLDVREFDLSSTLAL
jgi:transcriptional regulator with XRE-family HTH domain